MREFKRDIINPGESLTVGTSQSRKLDAANKALVRECLEQKARIRELEAQIAQMKKDQAIADEIERRLQQQDESPVVNRSRPLPGVGEHPITTQRKRHLSR